MRKKLVIIFVIFLMGLLTFSLAACGGNDNFEGEVAVTINLDKEYENVSVYCPEGDIEKNSNVKYTVKLSSTLPVDIILCCDGYEQIILRYKSEFLKKNLAITENVSFKQELYRFSFSISTWGVELAKDYQGIKLVNQSGIYILESEKPITQDIVLTVGEKYKPVILFKEVFKYVSSKGSLLGEIPLLQDYEDKIAVFLQDNNSNSPLMAYDVENYSEDSGIPLYYGSYTVVDRANYAVYKNSNYPKRLIKLKDIDDSYCILRNDDFQTFEYTVVTDSKQTLMEIQADYVMEINRYNTYSIMVTNRKIESGDTFMYKVYETVGSSSVEIKQYHKITEEEAQTRYFDFSKDNGISHLDGRKFMISLKDKQGNKLDNFSATFNGGIPYEESEVYTFDSDDLYWLYINHTNLEFEDKALQSLIVNSLVGSDEEIVTVDYVPVIKHRFEIKYRNKITGQIMEELTRVEHYVDGNSNIVLRPYNSNYSLVGNNKIVYFNEIFGNSIILDVMPNTDITIIFTNPDIIDLDQNLNNYFISADGLLEFGLGNLDSPKKLQVSELYAGKTLRFTLRSPYGEIKYYFDIEFPEDFSQLTPEERVFEVTIMEVDDEW